MRGSIGKSDSSPVCRESWLTCLWSLWTAQRRSSSLGLLLHRAAPMPPSSSSSLAIGYGTLQTLVDKPAGLVRVRKGTYNRTTLSLADQIFGFSLSVLGFVVRQFFFPLSQCHGLERLYL